ncbi:MAG: hypothetical protein Q8P18_08295 [Pseudomonadota bacterium]|nr:hypothetical protein [Pseudomonadota bacterium]
MLLSIALALVLGCQEGTTAPSTVVLARNEGIIVSAPGYRARVETAWKEAETVTLSKDAVALIQKVNAAVYADAPDKIRGLDPKTEMKDIRTDAALVELLLGTDEKAAADAIRATGARVMIVHSALRPSMDRSKNVMSRLYNHDGLDRFQLARVEEGALVYLVVDAPLQFSPELARQATEWLRATLEGKKPAPFPPVKPERSNWTLVASLRGRGQELAFSLAEGPTLDKALLEIANDLETMHRRNKEPLGFPPLAYHMPGIAIELHRVTERAPVVPREEGALEDLFEMGIDGAILLDRVGDKKQSGVWPGAVSTTRGITKADSFLRGIAKDFKWDSLRPWRESETELEIIRTVHYLEVPGKAVVPMYRGTPPVPMEFVNQTTVRESILLAGEWYLTNLNAEGEVTYKFWPEENRYSNEYNHVRHTLATWNLWQAYTLDPRPEFLEGAIRAQNWTLRWLGEKDGMAFMTHAGQTKLGSVVVALLGMIEVAKATGDHSNDELMRKFGKFVMFMQADSGTFRGYWNPKTGEFPAQVNDIVPGEAALSLVYLYEYFNDPQYLEPLPKFFEYYKPWYKVRADRKSEGGPWPAYTYDNATRLELVQFGPWTVMAAAAYTRVKPEAKDIAAFGLEVGRWMIDTYEYTEDNAPFPDYVGGYYKFAGELPAMQAFCYAEGTAAAYDMALRMDPAQAPYFEKHTREAVRMGFQMQHDGVDSVYYSRPLEIMGGIKYALNEPKVRIDYVHHGLSAMYQWLMASKNDPNLPAIAKAEPDDAMKAFLKLQDMPSFRDQDLPAWRMGDGLAYPGQVRRTSVAPTTLDPVAAAAAARGKAQATISEDDGAE